MVVGRSSMAAALMAMTETEAKELLIDGMNYAAYKETEHSLSPADKDKLFGEIERAGFSNV